MTPEQIQKLADGLPPSCMGKDHEEVVVWLAKQHIALQQQVNALAAENKVLDSAIGAIANAYETGVSDILAQEIDTAVNIETPVTDAIKRQWMAKGVEEFGKYIALYHSDSVHHAKQFAAQLRQPEEKGQ
ncbi:hypothetical protein J3D56_004226 [Erwinia persicina]|uniref:hypothetical protein n=1 Tax=Erwinia persicina TaxID=55211 RepID=UPI00209F7B1F|nr:hypothetical protein [Erwinia persicina]MCP1440790.1 hypothetical protein [Erwinia persicina]